MITKKEIVEKRRKLPQQAQAYNTFKKGDKRVFTPRVCSICGRPLSSLLLREQKYITIQDHVMYHLSSLAVISVCKDVKSCYTTLRKKGELEDGNG